MSNFRLPTVAFGEKPPAHCQTLEMAIPPARLDEWAQLLLEAPPGYQPTEAIFLAFVMGQVCVADFTVTDLWHSRHWSPTGYQQQLVVRFYYHFLGIQ